MSVPKDPRCRITDLLLIRANANQRKQYEWYGFEVISENDRFENIERAKESKLIPQEVALQFAEFFSINLFGIAKYSATD